MPQPKMEKHVRYGEIFCVHLTKKPYESWVEMNGERLKSVASVRIEQDARTEPKVTLELIPESVFVFGQALPNFKISEDRARTFGVTAVAKRNGYDPYNSMDAT